MRDILRFGRVLLLLFIIASLLPYLIPASGNLLKTQDLTTAESRFMTVDNTTLHYHYFQTGNPEGTVVFVHGFGGSLFSFRNNCLPLVEEGYNVLLVDLPGFGLSERSLRADYSNEGRARLLKNLADELTLPDPVHWVGHSMGGSILAWLPIFYPDSAGSLTLIAAPYHVQPSAPWTQTVLRYPPVQEYLKAVLPRFITKERVGSLLSSAYGRPLKEYEVYGYLNPLLVENTHRTYVGLTRDRSSQRPPATSLTTPVLLIWGEEDTWVPPTNAPLWCSDIPNCTIALFAGAGHNLMETHTEQFNTRLKEFILSTAIESESTP